MAAAISSGVELSDDWKACAVPWNEPSSVIGVLQLALRPAGLLDRLAERHAGRQVERDRHRRELALVVDR